MMEHYTIGNDAEALDSFGVWHRCTVKFVGKLVLKFILLAGQTSGTGPSGIRRAFAMYAR